MQNSSASDAFAEDSLVFHPSPVRDDGARSRPRVIDESIGRVSISAVDVIPAFVGAI